MPRSGGMVVLGGTGLLGQAFAEALARRGERCLLPNRAALDLAQIESVGERLAALAPTAVVNAAAFTDVARAELPAEHDALWRLNRDAPAVIAETCRDLGVPLVQLSTDYVFDGAKARPYAEDDAPAPLQAYGRSKLEGEQAVLDRWPQALIVRTSTLFGPGRRERPHYVDAVLRRARAEGRLELVATPVASPTYAPDLAEAVLELLKAGAEGRVHVVNSGGCGRVELATEALRLAGLAGLPISTRAELPGGPQRPVYSVLATERLARWTGRPLRPWQTALRAYLQGEER